MDESGLQYKLTSLRVLAPKDIVQVSGPKKQLERITFAVYSNAAGSLKLSSIVIRKSKKPYYFKNVAKKNFPVFHRCQKSAWMDYELFKGWFENVSVPLVEELLFRSNLFLRAILIVDNCRSHKYF